MERISLVEIERIQQLRATGHSLNEIKSVVRRGVGTIHRYAKGVIVGPQYVEILKGKQRTSLSRSRARWAEAGAQIRVRLGNISSRDKLLVLSCLYWGEGTKRELSIINGDPDLISVFAVCLREIGVTKSQLKISLRLFEDIDILSAKEFWASKLGVPSSQVSVGEVKRGQKAGKYEFGMCRLRVTKGDVFFKQIMSMIKSIKSDLAPVV